MRQTAQKFKLFVSRPTLALAVFTVLLLVSMTGTYVLNVRRAAAATNSTINFQARLMDASGAIAPDGNYNVEFKLYNAITSSGSSQGSCTGDASCLWAETRTSANTVHVANGYVTVSLGSVTSFPTTINWDQKLWLTMNIGGTGTPTWDGEMTPRLQLTAVPYAFRAGQLATLSGVNTASLQFAGSFGQNTTITLPDPGASTASVCYQTATACGFAPTSGSANYIQNTTTAQSANIAVQSSADASVTLLLKQRSTQTADILRIADSSNTTIFNVDAFGDMHQSGAASFNSYVGVGMASSSGEQLRVAVLNASTSGLTIYANSAQTADLIGVDGAGTRALNYTGAGTLVVTAGSGQATSLLDLRNTTGDTLSKFDASGQLTLGRIAASGTTQAGTLIFSDGTNDNFGVTLNTNTLTANRTIRLPDAGGTICLQSSASCGFATGTTASYIQNQNAGQQATSNYWISGTGRSDTSLLTPALDTAIAGTLSLGTTTATAIALNKDTTITGALTQSGGAFSLTGNNNSSISTSANALTITSTSTATWSVTAGTLNLQANSTNNRLELNGAGNIVTLHSGGTLNLGDANSSLVYLGGTTNNVRTINVGVGGGLLTQAQTVNVGSLAGTSVTTVNGGSGSGAIALTPAANGGIIATTTGTGSISLNSGASIIAKSTTNNNAAFQIQNTAAETVLGVDTTANAANLVTNPSFETNTTNWSQRTGCALSRVGTTVAFGAWSGDCLTSATANAGVNYALTLSSSTQYTMSFYAKASGSFSTLDFGYAQNGATENTAGLVKTGNTVNSTGWQRYTLTFTTGTVSGSPYFFFKQSDAVLRDIYIDGLQVEASGGASAYESSKLSFNGGVSSSLIVQPAENSNTALAVYTNGGTQAFNVNTLTNRVGIGSLNAGARLHVAGSTSSIPVQIVQGASGQSTDILQIEDSNDNVNAAFNSTGAQLTLGRVSNVAGKLVLNDSASAFGTTLQNATLTVGSQTITIPNTAGAGGTICLQSSASCGFATGTTASYIQNQNAGQQATSNYWISGTGRSDTSLLTPALDALSGGALSIGISNASSVTLGGGSTSVKIGALGGVTATSAAVCRDTSSTTLTACDATNTSGRPFLQGGNAFGATSVLGTTDANNLQIVTGGASNIRATFDTSNNLYLGNGITASAPNNFTVAGTGSSAATVAGGALSIIGGNGNTTGTGGAITVQGGTGGATGTGGTATLQGGTGGATSGTGGAANVTGGTAVGVFTGGLVTIQGGAAAATAGSTGGGVAIASANGSGTGTGGAAGSILLDAGNAQGSGNNIGGSITLSLGASTGTGVEGTFQIQNALGANLLTADPTNTAAELNVALNSGAEVGTTTPTSWAAHGSATLSRDTTAGHFTSGIAAAAAATTGATQGVRNNVGTAMAASTTYVVSFSVKVSVALINANLSVVFSPTGTTSNNATCSTMNSSYGAISTSAFIKYTCSLTTTATATTSSAYLAIFQADATSRSIYVDNLNIISQNASGAQNTGDLRVGGSSSQGLTLFTLDTAAGTPFTGANASLAGSMYFDTTQGKIQCYDGTSWGACGAAPNNVITLSPEFANAVLHATGTSSIGTLTSDFCSNSLAINDGSSGQPTICVSNQTFNFYRWTSPQSTTQQYSIFVTYQMPNTFKNFSAGSVSLTARTDSTNSTVQYTVYKNASGVLTACGSATSVSTGVQSNWLTVSPSTDPSTCSFAAGNSIVFKIDVLSSNNANAYVSNLNFTFANQ